MNDRELLEMAAKAAKITHEGLDDPDDETSGLWVSWATSWNPLTDDGDALRLAVNLGLLVYVFHDPAMTCIRLPGDRIGGKYDEVEMHGNDPYAATRRAIVRAAAEIGLQMQEGGAA